MKKMRKTIFSLILALFTIAFVSCENDDAEEDGRNAANDFCDCMDNGNSVEECEERLKDKYSYATYTDNDFKKGFDQAGKSCGIAWEITRE